MGRGLCRREWGQSECRPRLAQAGTRGVAQGRGTGRGEGPSGGESARGRPVGSGPPPVRAGPRLCRSRLGPGPSPSPAWSCFLLCELTRRVLFCRVLESGLRERKRGGVSLTEIYSDVYLVLAGKNCLNSCTNTSLTHSHLLYDTIHEIGNTIIPVLQPRKLKLRRAYVGGTPTERQHVSGKKQDLHLGSHLAFLESFSP